MTPLPPPASWRPSLTDGDALRAIEAARAIAADLPAPGEAETPGSSLTAGEAGRAVFFAYLEAACPGEGHGERGMAHLDRAVELLAAEAEAPDLLFGFTGVAWAVEHLQGRLFEPDEDGDLNAEIDEELAAHLAQSPWRRPFELIGGLVGHAVYALRRLPRPRAAVCLERVVDRLSELAIAEPSGLTWPDPAAGRFADGPPLGGDVRLGVAHGVPGVIAALARVRAAGIAEAAAGRLIDGAVRWLSAHAAGGQVSLFPAPLDAQDRYAYPAWCHGDPGSAAALLVAARALGDARLEREALALARFAARPPEGVKGMGDCGLCHGAAGLAHLFARLSRATGDSRLEEVAISWYRYVLAQRRPGQGVGGFLSRGRIAGGAVGWRDDATLLLGSLGVGLALLAAATPIEPCWDELLLLSPLSVGASSGAGG
ncbi:MAG TPA: lanthionine synthetase LanC family protein [Thermoanaerobaculia bacterium]